MPERKPFRKFRKKSKPLTIEQKIRQFVLRNSRNGYFTKVSTLPYKFEITEDKAWEVLADILTDGKIESIHDESTGEMKLCETGKTYKIMDLELKRKKERTFTKPKNKNS